MYLDRFGLRHPPFEETTNPIFRCDTAAVRSIREGVTAYVRAGTGLVLVEGDAGTGKTMLARTLRERLGDDIHVLTLTPPQAGEGSIIAQLAAASDVVAPEKLAKEDGAGIVVHALKQQAPEHNAVIVDEAERLGVDGLRDIARLLASAEQAGVSLTFVLLATAEIHGVLRQPELVDVAERLRRTAMLQHLDPGDTSAYIASRLRAAGAPSAALFTPEAIDKIARLAQGNMRRINALAGEALARTAQFGLDRVGAEQVADPSGKAPRNRSAERVEAAARPVAAPRATQRSDREADSEQNMQPPNLVSSADCTRIERIVERFAEITSAAPRQIADLDARLDSLSQRADAITREVRDYLDQLNDSRARAGEQDMDASAFAPRLESLTADARQAQDRLEGFVRKLTEIDAASEERIALLLSGLESAQDIQEKLEAAGQQVSTLIEDSRQSAVAERDALVRVFQDLSGRREELAAMIDTLRHQRQAALEENEQAISAMIERCRNDAAQACAASSEALAEARRTADANRSQLVDQVTAATRRLADVRTTGERILTQVRTLQADIDARHAALHDQSVNYDERIRNLTTAAERAEKAAARAEELTLASTATEQRLRDAIARFETLVAAESSARATAEDAVKTARTVLAGVREAETKLADAQAATIDVEATASAALASVQQQIKRFEDSVGVIARHGAEKVRGDISTMLAATSARISETTAALEAAIEAGNQRVRGEVAAAATEIHGHRDHAIKTVHEQVDRAADELRDHRERATASIDQAACLAAECIEKDVSQATTAIRVACTNAVNRTDEKTAELLAATEHELNRRHAETLENASAATSKLNRDLDVFAEHAESMLSTRVEEAVAGALGRVAGTISAAKSSGESLAAIVADAHRLLLEASTTREQIDHQIRDVWALTTTTDERARALAALGDKARGSASHLAELLRTASANTAPLTTLVEAARKTTTGLAAQHEQVKAICATFAERISEARRVCDDVAGANEIGATLAPELRTLLDSAAEIVDALRSGDEAARKNHAVIVQLSSATAGLDTKVTELQEALASPMAIIHDARAQADELNETCLAVKRVFRGVSQASLQANERIKLLGKLLVATEKSAHTVKQWVEEATRTQSRLADTIAMAPRIDETHPLVALPDIAARIATPPAPAKTTPAAGRIEADVAPTGYRVTGANQAVAVANASSQTRPVAAPVGKSPSAAKLVEPLVDVLKARQAQTVGAERLSPEDVQAMVDQARQNAPTGP